MTTETDAMPLPSRLDAPARSATHTGTRVALIIRSCRGNALVITAEITGDSDTQPITAAVGDVVKLVNIVTAAVEMFSDYIQGETLAATLLSGSKDCTLHGIEPVTLQADGDELQLYVGL